MRHIFKEEFDEIDIKLRTNEWIKVKESKIATFGLHQSWAFVCFSLFIVTAQHIFSLCYFYKSPEIIKKPLGLPMILGSIEKKHGKEKG